MAPAKPDNDVEEFDGYWRFNQVKNMSEEELQFLAWYCRICDSCVHPYSATECNNEELHKSAQDRGMLHPPERLTEQVYYYTWKRRSANHIRELHGFSARAEEFGVQVSLGWATGGVVLFCAVIAESDLSTNQE
ncbi:hypothetical protein LTR56_027764 [Elasticomyces elasticus]|nr:hypothetical protein LTR56_027764 [Elasticomyces elasticus]